MVHSLKKKKKDFKKYYPGLIKHHLWALEPEMKAHQREGGRFRTVEISIRSWYFFSQKVNP